MQQFISRPTVYFVIGIGVLALLVSQFRSTDNQASTSVSELDPFNSLENLSGRNLMKSIPDWEAIAAPANVNQVEMVRDEMTSTKPYQQTAAAMLNSVTSDAQQTASTMMDGVTSQAQQVVESIDTEAFNSPFQLAEIDAVETQAPIEAQAQVIDQINAADDSLTVLDLDEPIMFDNELSDERYQLDDIAVDTEEASTPTIDPIAEIDEPTTDAEPTSAFQNTNARIVKGNSLRPRGWRKNPFMDQVKPTSEAVEVETSSIETLPDLDDTDSFSMGAVISTEMSGAEEVSMAGNFEPENAPSVVSVIPSSREPLQSVMSAEQQYQHNESLPIVIGLSDSVAHKAVHNIEYGKSLSRRGAAFAARQEFYSSLRILAQAHDSQAGGKAYTRALRDAIIALKEAEDFIVSDTETQIGLNVDAVVEGHSTKLIPATEAVNMTAIDAMQRYFSFASTQLRVASGQNPVAAEALYCLGKLHTVQAKFRANASKLDVAKAIVFHQAAIASDRTNYRSANELGVLMANSGRLQESQNMLKRSLQIEQLPQAWQNLAVVHQRAGQAQLAQLAQQEFLISSRKSATGMAQNTIRWMAPKKFNQGTPLELRQGAAQRSQIQQPVPQQGTGKPTISQRLKSLF